jgi:hypothetical protein
MKNDIDMDLIDRLLPPLRRLLPKDTKRVPFSELNENNAEKVANSVKVKTLMDLYNMPPIDDRTTALKGDGPIILVLCQPSEEICIQKG